MINYIASLLYNAEQAQAEQDRQKQIGQKGLPGKEAEKAIQASSSNSPPPSMEMVANSFGQISETIPEGIASGSKQISNGKLLAVSKVKPKKTSFPKKMVFLETIVSSTKLTTAERVAMANKPATPKKVGTGPPKSKEGGPPLTPSPLGDESLFEIELSPIKLDNKRLELITEDSTEELDLPPAKKGLVPAPFNVDNLIKRLLQFRDTDSWDGLSEYEVTECIRHAKEALKLQSMLLEVEAPLKICGDIHGQYSDLLNLFENAGYPPKSRFLFLGDYVDRGPHSVEVICLLFAFKIKYPYDFFMLRGNHEERETNKTYGFQDECKTRYGYSIYNKFNDVFNWLPIAAIVEDEIFCAHGGISKEINPYPGDWSQIQAIKRPARLNDSDLMIDILWSDPNADITGYVHSQRGISYNFGDDVIEKFCNDKGIRLICRGHQLVDRGFEFGANDRILTIFSAPNYCNRFRNHGAYLIVDENLNCHVEVYD